MFYVVPVFGRTRIIACKLKRLAVNVKRAVVADIGGQLVRRHRKRKDAVDGDDGMYSIGGAVIGEVVVGQGARTPDAAERAVAAEYGGAEIVSRSYREVGRPNFYRCSLGVLHIIHDGDRQNGKQHYWENAGNGNRIRFYVGGGVRPPSEGVIYGTMVEAMMQNKHNLIVIFYIKSLSIWYNSNMSYD